MARGWESKSVEEHKALARDRPAAPTPELSTEARDRAQQVSSLQMARARTLQQLQGACDRRHRAQLEQALAALDAEIARSV